MTEIDMKWVRTQRAEAKLEIELWNIINEFLAKQPTETESKLTRTDILHVLCHMSARIATEIQWEQIKK